MAEPAATAPAADIQALKCEPLRAVGATDGVPILTRAPALAVLPMVAQCTSAQALLLLNYASGR
ncbi:hypothetical protein BEN49_17675 [Hymenobacter coccineus]|uniref:Uncharacterized protein n=2 Tax=Hymenobacter coccineus TaxID=1908235 RepID=A0A1G1TGH7_9BACT|nr:hypothetical protein BEN49_24240 [Hymenobacter coccineus]OGX92021.1 hypothetical protein BEN49_17675 [Hymenobacter coccineus]